MPIDPTTVPGSARPSAQPLVTAPLPSPLVSIGMPVYNGERHLAQALDSLLAQEYSHFELLISDNASQDRTAEICREYQARDARIRFVRQPENRGSPWNFAFVAREARGEYFLWAAHDDLWEPSFLRKCVAALEAHPEAMLCCTEIAFIDAQGAPSSYYPGYRNIDTLGMPPVERIHALLSLPGWFAIYGLMRRCVLPRISLGLSAYAWDVILLLEILLLGPTAKVAETLFTFRVTEPKTAADYSQIFKSEAGVPAKPYAGAAADLLRIVYGSSLSSHEKTQAFAHFILDCQKPPWRPTIAPELLGANVAVDDRQFALLLGLALTRSVPLEEMDRNPLCKAIFRSAIDPPDLLRIARRILSRPNPAHAPLPGGEISGESSDEPLRVAVGHLDGAIALLHEILAEPPAAGGRADCSRLQLACGRLAEAEQRLRRAVSQQSGPAASRSQFH
jgi:hypothetical protein